MIYRIVFFVFLLSFSSVRAEPAKWNSFIDIDDFDDSKTFTSGISAPRQGSIAIRYHENTPGNYEVFWMLPGTIFLGSCGDSGDWMEHSGWRNIEVRVDGGKILSLTGTPSTNKKAAFLNDGSTDTVESLVKSLSSAKKVVIRVKDKCHEEGKTWLFSKYEDIAGKSELSGIRFQHPISND